jgi:hypothetical protein
MNEVELVLGLLVLVAALALLSHRLGTPYPIVPVLGGLLTGLVPGLPDVDLARSWCSCCSCHPWSTARRSWRAVLDPGADARVGAAGGLALRQAAAFGRASARSRQSVNKASARYTKNELAVPLHHEQAHQSGCVGAGRHGRSWTGSLRGGPWPAAASWLWFRQGHA